MRYLAALAELHHKYGLKVDRIRRDMNELISVVHKKMKKMPQKYDGVNKFALLVSQHLKEILDFEDNNDNLNQESKHGDPVIVALLVNQPTFSASSSPDYRPPENESAPAAAVLVQSSASAEEKMLPKPVGWQWLRSCGDVCKYDYYRNEDTLKIEEAFQNFLRGGPNKLYIKIDQLMYAIKFNNDANKMEQFNMETGFTREIRRKERAP